ncbi:addiction module protein [Haloferula sp. A504]|uniref:addiction module protein n=1 Tax=Haloferula sp. A504 TaxID=3373601 RepID=UPI0031C4EE26|nr:addiction module protein [Verrucomicrobiaceae bacterium E54]
MKLKEIQESALELPDSDRAALAAELLGSLPAVLVEDDDGLAEARRRSRELDEDPAAGRTWEEIKQGLGR